MILEQLPAVKQWPTAMKLQLASELWDEVLAHQEDIQVSPEHRAEIERSMAEFEREPSKVTTWEAVKARILAGHGRE
jgi:putative addiction module component (TIGR02574 family)